METRASSNVERPDPSKAEGPPRMTLIEKIIDASARNPFLVIILTILAASASLWALRNTPLDAIPDLSDTQVIISTDWQGRSPIWWRTRLRTPFPPALSPPRR